MNLPSWYDAWLSNDPSDQPEPPECRCGTMMEWNEVSEMLKCPECEKEETK